MCLFWKQSASLSSVKGPIDLQLIMENLKAFNTAVTTDTLLFQVDTLLASPEVVFHPSANEVYQLTLQCVLDCVEG